MVHVAQLAMYLAIRDCNPGIPGIFLNPEIPGLGSSNFGTENLIHFYIIIRVSTLLYMYISLYEGIVHTVSTAHALRDVLMSTRATQRTLAPRSMQQSDSNFTAAKWTRTRCHRVLNQ
jgi:hypothetical protein